MAILSGCVLPAADATHRMNLTAHSVTTPAIDAAESADSALDTAAADHLAADSNATEQPIISFNVRPGIQAHLSLQETRIMLRVNQAPAVQVNSLNVPLFREWGRIYFKVSDYDRDGMNDLAILHSTGNVGTQRCYGIYRYNPTTGQFRTQKSFDRCGI